MSATDALKTVEEKMNNALHAYTHRSWSDTELQGCLIDELKATTIDFLEMRRRSSLGR
jgi:hypothetical protein